VICEILDELIWGMGVNRFMRNHLTWSMIIDKLFRQDYKWTA